MRRGDMPFNVHGRQNSGAIRYVMAILRAQYVSICNTCFCRPSRSAARGRALRTRRVRGPGVGSECEWGVVAEHSDPTPGRRTRLVRDTRSRAPTRRRAGRLELALPQHEPTAACAAEQLSVARDDFA